MARPKQRHFLIRRGALVTVAVCAIYGLGVAFGTPLWGARFADGWLRWGWGICAILFLRYIVWEWLKSLVLTTSPYVLEHELERKRIKRAKKSRF